MAELQGRKIYNDLVDEQIDLENPEEVLNNMEAIKNQPIDEVHQISDGSADDVPSPQDEEGGSLLSPSSSARRQNRHRGKCCWRCRQQIGVAELQPC